MFILLPPNLFQSLSIFQQSEKEWWYLSQSMPDLKSFLHPSRSKHVNPSLVVFYFDIFLKTFIKILLLPIDSKNHFTSSLNFAEPYLKNFKICGPISTKYQQIFPYVNVHKLSNFKLFGKIQFLFEANQ